MIRVAKSKWLYRKKTNLRLRQRGNLTMVMNLMLYGLNVLFSLKKKILKVLTFIKEFSNIFIMIHMIVVRKDQDLCLENLMKNIYISWWSKDLLNWLWKVKKLFKLIITENNLNSTHGQETPRKLLPLDPTAVD